MNPNVVTAEFQLKEIQAAARVMGQRIEIFNASSECEINLAFDTMALGALLVGADPFFQVWRPQLIDLALRHRIPTMYEWAEFVTPGGLASYSTNRAEAYRPAGQLCRPDPQGREARRPAGRAVDQVRAGDQPQNRHGARS